MGGYGTPVVVDREAALGRVRPPAMAIMVYAGLSVLMAIVMLLLQVLGVSMAGLAPEAGAGDQIANLIGGGLGIVYYLLAILMNAIALFGATRMNQGRSYTLAWVATVITAIPCGCCCLIGIGIAIWSAIVLMDEQVKQAFTD